MSMFTLLNTVKKLALDESSIDIIWLYGSRAKDNWQHGSDFDLAISVNDLAKKGNYFCDELAYQWSVITQAKISMIDISHVPVPLAITVINEGKVVWCKNDLKLHFEMQRVWSLWELYRYEHKKHRK